MNHPFFVLIAGPNGSGKSTLTKSLEFHDLDIIEVIDPDLIAKEMAGSYENVEKYRVRAGKEAIKRVKQCIDDKRSFVVESTISGKNYLKYNEQAKKSGFHTVLIYIDIASVAICCDRVKKRVSEGGHDIPSEDIIRRYEKSRSHFEEYKKHFDTIAVLKNDVDLEPFKHFLFDLLI